jgi:hypothetical protein
MSELAKKKKGSNGGREIRVFYLETVKEPGQQEGGNRESPVFFLFYSVPRLTVKEEEEKKEEIC